jgi:prepilin-type N-terminal cleavage/methylation domain-containing protein/prepilin-type processing-associated H-X9-DG protein
MSNQHVDRGNARRGFTLVELLVVIGIIAVLIGILLPSLSRARAAAKGTQCLSNLRQMTMGMIMYADANRGFLPPVNGGNQKFTINGSDWTVAVRWYGGAYGPTSPTSPSVTDGIFYGPAAPAARYWGAASVSGCPSFEEAADLGRVGYGPVAYAYNALAGHQFAAMVQYPGLQFATGAGERLSRIRKADQKAALWDAARLPAGKAVLERTPWGYPSTGAPNTGKREPSFHGRHNKQGNVGWFDGHASAAEPYYFDDLGGGTADPQLLKRYRLGLIETDHDMTTDEHYGLFN